MHEAQDGAVCTAVSTAESPGGRGDRDAYYFPFGMGTTDPMHIIWNAFEKAITTLELWPEYESQLRGCLAFLGHPRRRQKFMVVAKLTAQERSALHNWKHKLIDWKWQYMSQMWGKFSSGALRSEGFLQLGQLRNPIFAEL